MSEYPSKLAFTIEESVWLNKGQEIDAIIGMSLEPEITIEEQNKQVHIKGGLRLISQYESSDQEEQTQIDDGLDETQSSFRSVGEITRTADGANEIKHFFPIDITIPISRIRNLDDVYVQVDSFDYDLPEKSCIQLTADISISGMTNQQEVEEKEKLESVDEITRTENVTTSFSYDAKKVENENRPLVNDRLQKELPKKKKVETEEKPTLQLETNECELRLEKKEPVADSNGRNELEMEDEQSHIVVDEVSIGRDNRLEKAQSLINPSEEETKEKKDTQVDFSAEQSESEILISNIPSKQKESERLEIAEDQQELSAQRPTLEETMEEVEVEQTRFNLVPSKGKVDKEIADEKSVEQPLTYKEENALYLTKMMSKEEERFTTCKLCIIQENESLETIANRYGISTSQLVRMNRLEQEKIAAGQILYIPVT